MNDNGNSVKDTGRTCEPSSPSTSTGTRRDWVAIKTLWYRLTGDTGTQDQPLLPKTTAKLKLIGDLFIEIGKIAAFIGISSAALGILVGCNYLSSSGVPMLEAVALATPIFTATALGVSAFSFFLFVPGVLAIINNGWMSALRDAGFWQKAQMFLLCYAAAVGITIAFLVLLGLSVVDKLEHVAAIFYGLVGSFLILQIVIFTKLWLRGRSAKSHLPHPLGVILGNLLLALSVGEVFLVIEQFVSLSKLAEWIQILCVVLPFALLISLIGFMLWPTRTQKQSPLGYLIVVPLIVFISVPLSWGGTALRLLGIGGSLPVSLSLKQTLSGESTPVVRPRTGCLLLMTSSDVYFQPGIARRDCKPEIRFMPSYDPKPPAYHELVRYVRSDIITVSEYPKLYWIDTSSQGQLGLAEFPANPEQTLSYWRMRGFARIRSLTALDFGDLSQRGSLSMDLDAEEKAAKSNRINYERQPSAATFGERSPPVNEDAFEADVCSLKSQLDNGNNIIIEGSYVHGRASFLAVAVLIANGITPQKAITEISNLIGDSAVAATAQRAFLDRMPKCTATK